MPIILAAVKSIGKTAPARITRKNFLFFGRSKSILCFKQMQKIYCLNISAELFFCTTRTKHIIGNTVIVLLAFGYIRAQVIRRCCYLRLCFLYIRSKYTVVAPVCFYSFFAYCGKFIKFKHAKLAIV